jgi:branched-chain amino acid transport system permease protein
LDASILLAATINGLLIGGIYTLVASGLTLIYGVLHIINFAHGSLLMLAMFGVYFLLTKLGVDPYLSLVVMVPAMFALGYVMYRGLIGKLAHGKDEVAQGRHGGTLCHPLGEVKRRAARCGWAR